MSKLVGISEVEYTSWLKMKSRSPIEILVEEIDEEVLERMPEWFRKLREAYIKTKNF